MTKITVKRKEFMSFLSSFGKGIPDLRINCAGGRLTVEVAYAWYYLRKQFVTDVNEEGVIHIADLDKVLLFLKSSNQDEITLRQTQETKPLYLEGGGNKLQLPSTDDIESASKTVVIRKLIKESQESGWSSFGHASLSTHASLATKDLISLAGMRGLVSKDTQFNLRIHCGENEMGIVAGKAVSGRLFTTLPVWDSDGPAATVESYFSEKLPMCLQFLDDEDARMHMGKSTCVIFEQDNTLLMIVDESDD